MTIIPLLLAMTASLLALTAWTRRPGLVNAQAVIPPPGASAAPGQAYRHVALRDPAAGSAPRLAPRPVMLGPLIERAISAALRAVRPGLRHWQVDPALRRRMIAADAGMLEGALAALLRRAVVHSREGDIIALRWVEATETVAIVVEDEGDGLPGLGAEQDEAGTVTSLGVGLHHARRLAAAQGGDVRLEAAPGIGARAWLTLPRDRVVEAN
jgi:signal transduction histidine kinase